MWVEPTRSSRRTSLCLDFAHDRKWYAPTTSSGQVSLKRGRKTKKPGSTLNRAGTEPSLPSIIVFLSAFCNELKPSFASLIRHAQGCGRDSSLSACCLASPNQSDNGQIIMRHLQKEDQIRIVKKNRFSSSTLGEHSIILSKFLATIALFHN